MCNRMDERQDGDDVTEHEEIRLKLVARMEELNERLHGIEQQLHQPADADVEERAVEREDDEMLERLGLTGQEEIRRITAALDRIENGTFGICAACGEEISPERLAVVPFAARCRNCA